VTNGKTSKNYMAIDFGTSHVKVSIGAPTDQPLASIKDPAAYFRPTDAPVTAVEFDPAQALKLIISVAQRAVGASNIAPSDIHGIGVTSQRQGLVLLNLESTPHRAEACGRRLKAKK
jgi:sugar (pentulose or hexulose) kinase